MGEDLNSNKNASFSNEKKPNKRSRYLTIPLLIILLAALYFYLNGQYNVPTKVNLQGMINATGNNVTITNLTFSIGKNSIPVFIPLQNPQVYTLQVPLSNFALYNVTVGWVDGHNRQKGVDTFVYNLSQSGGFFVGNTVSVQHNFNIPTPYSDILVSGQVKTNRPLGIQETTPIRINFSMLYSTGKQFTTNVNNAGMYNLSLPNAEYYHVVVFYKDTSNVTRNCTPSNNPYSLYKGNSISNDTQIWSC